MKRSDILKSSASFIVQILCWVMFMTFAPLIIYIQSADSSTAMLMLKILALLIVPGMVVFFVNCYILVPRLFFRSRSGKILFFAINALVVIGYNIFTTYNILGSRLPEGAWLGVVAGMSASAVIDYGAIGIAVAVRNYMRNQEIAMQLVEEKRRRIESELVWLKNQLNPHFLFNSLNNISSLILLDQDKAQDSIGRLRDLLRYALYESDKSSVPIARETEFMRNYIELMSLRCSEKTEVTYDLDYDNAHAQIVPLLLIPLVENAFKHGTSSSQSSFVRFVMKEDSDLLTFVSENSNHQKTDTDRSGSGIGIANTRKRLDLVYDGNYQWHQYCDENLFRVELKINLSQQKVLRHEEDYLCCGR